MNRTSTILVQFLLIRVQPNYAYLVHHTIKKLAEVFLFYRQGCYGVVSTNLRMFTTSAVLIPRPHPSCSRQKEKNTVATRSMAWLTRMRPYLSRG